MTLFRPVTPKLSVQDLEREQLEFWKAQNVMARTYSERAGGPRFVFYEGPPTSNGRPGSHHVLSRAFKDMFPRYRIMRGYQVLRKGGWDTHGLPVEIEVEKELGIKHKSEIEVYGIAEFNKKCRESVFRYMQEWARLTERIAFWVSLDDAYVTYHNDYIESVWWILRQLWDKGLLYQGYKVVPYCARCGTPLSTHELAQGYEEVDDPSVYVRFALKDEAHTSFLAWTTTPWTLPGNMALAVNKDADYVLVEGKAQYGAGTERLILAEALLTKALRTPEEYTVIRRMKGAELLGKHYEPMFSFLPVESGQDYAYVVHGDFVSMEDGTGIVHIAPAFGADDLAMGQQYNLPILMTVKPDGTFVPEVTPWAGMWFKDADPQIVKHLKAQHILLRSEKYHHDYPFCWRCHSPLLYYARTTWFVATTRYRERMVELNNTIHWEPEHIKQGRFGNWLAENRDWALGRERYWGTPLPMWTCDNPGCDHKQCIGSVAELSQLTGKDQSALDLHRPYVDDVTWPCEQCGKGTMRRVPELIDVWFDSGSMPVAQWGYPAHGHERFEEQFPADYICEAIDQTRGWFYSLHAIASLVFDSVAYKNVICLGHILDENGRKMSKTEGNIVEPWSVLDKYGADAFRWYLYTASAPGDSRRFSVELVGDVIRNFYLTLWNTYSFFVTYANIDGFDPTKVQVPLAERDELDRWVLSELHQLVRRVTAAYESYDATEATRPIQAFIDDLSNWYLRRSRRRFWKTTEDTDKAAAYLTLYECLLTVAKLLAPAMPFLADALYRNLVSVDKNAPESVHLAHWPDADEALIDQRLLDDMELIKRLSELGRSAREAVGIKLRQPLAEGMFAVRNPAELGALKRLEYLLSDELNLKAIHLLDSVGGVVAYTVHPLPSKLGKRLGSDFPRVQKLVREADAEQATGWARQLLDGRAINVNYDGLDGSPKTAELAPDDVEVRRSAAGGFAIAEGGGYMVALKTELTDELEAEGLTRETVRRIQVMRRDADFALDDRIALTYQASDKLARALAQFADYLRTETLADQIEIGMPADGQTFKFEDGETITVSVKRLERSHA
ncbi:MAG: isoleucine--tRNA ligase [Aggregatilineales bacterium]